MTRWKKRIKGLLLVVVALGVTTWLVLQLPSFGGMAQGARLARMQTSPQWHNGRFENTPPYVSDMSILLELHDLMGDEVRAPTFEVPVQKMRTEDLALPAAPGLRAWWLGHASALIEVDGVRILTDPVFSKRASPFQFAGPARLHPAPLPLEQWQNIDAVVISHDHFDHLDMATIQHLAQSGTHFYVGLGVGAHLERWQVPAEQIHEMDWWEQANIKGVTIVCTPARHYSGRTSMNNSTLWASWMLKGPNHSAYYSGDTGYAEHFKAIRTKLGTPELALVKVGAYGDSWMDIHMNPESAIEAVQDLGATTLLPVHWATFNLAYHAWAEPVQRTLAAAKGADVQVATPRVGEKFEFGQPFANQAWYLP
ncbi:MBL fold metallo-hydrolase [Rhodoferax saidenbachensis]|uniref:L-ascorbate metabolism protein UlaG (Beta-lactamase superfamily) n=1 Tax=Rhodoferax saidenbachensis TaxID=1484693 RepID=A0ABU1ZRZ1_9BURK|nr:MBL fold metallo-hydrolase [Rhodoferax saidenbachensis]MDR7307630.1 L-ascorbate metabolism protein UlaG (beta-lactamase superfamily) [Rhodoferax saidenbachensis]